MIIAACRLTLKNAEPQRLFPSFGHGAGLTEIVALTCRGRRFCVCLCRNPEQYEREGKLKWFALLFRFARRRWPILCFLASRVLASL
jgi:hypothetical protein